MTNKIVMFCIDVVALAGPVFCKKKKLPVFGFLFCHKFDENDIVKVRYNPSKQNYNPAIHQKLETQRSKLCYYHRRATKLFRALMLENVRKWMAISCYMSPETDKLLQPKSKILNSVWSSNSRQRFNTGYAAVLMQPGLARSVIFWLPCSKQVQEQYRISVSYFSIAFQNRCKNSIAFQYHISVLHFNIAF